MDWIRGLFTLVHDFRRNNAIIKRSNLEHDAASLAFKYVPNRYLRMDRHVDVVFAFRADAFHRLYMIPETS